MSVTSSGLLKIRRERSGFLKHYLIGKLNPGEKAIRTLKLPPVQSGGFIKVGNVIPGQSPVIYIQVEDIEPYLEMVSQLEGGVIQGKSEIAHMGWFAHMSDLGTGT